MPTSRFQSVPPKMPGYPKPLPQPPRQAPASPPSSRLNWSRQVLDQAARQSQSPTPGGAIPNVRSTAAARARAGEWHAPPPPAPAPALAPLPPQEFTLPPIEPPVAPPPSLAERLAAAFSSLLNLIPKAPQISD